MSSQQELIDVSLDPRRCAVVSACAGSGKTWLLVSRIFRLLLEGSPPSSILAITFTRKAAQEMTARLDRLLQEAAMADDDALDRLLDERAVALPPDAESRKALHARARCLFEQVLTARPPLTVATFHGWFLQLVQRAPLEAGTLSGQTLTEENASLVAEAMQRFGAKAARSAPLADALDHLFASCGLDSTLALLGSFIADRASWWAMAQGEADPLESMAASLAASLPAALRDDPAVDLLQPARADEGLLRDLASYRELLVRNNKGKEDNERAARLDEAAQRSDAQGWHACVRAALYTKGGTGTAYKYEANDTRRKRLGDEGQAMFLDLFAGLTTRLDALAALLREQQAYRFNIAAFTCSVALLREFDAVKQQRQALDFADLEQQACRLLTDDDHAAFLHAKLDARYRHLLLDEFQDTNPLQWMALRAWLDAAQASGEKPTVFVVGDPKQSIYRFRGAEAGLFDAAREFLVQHFDACVLDQDRSRRCSGPVIDLVNALYEGHPVFTGFRTHEAFDRAKPGCIEVLPLVGRPERPGRKGGARGDPDGEGDAPALRDPLVTARDVEEDQRVAQEAAMLVDGLRRWKGRAVVGEDGAQRPARWGDMLVLVRTRGRLDLYEQALREAGIPCSSSRQGGLLDTLEVRDMVALLRFLVAPHDGLALAQALRSPVFSVSDPDLVDIVSWGAIPAADGSVAPCAPRDLYRRLCERAGAPGARPEVRRAAALLARWFGLAGTRPVHDLLDAIYFDADVPARYRASVGSSAGASVEANLLALLEHALAADSGRFPTLARFVDELRDLADAPAQEALDEPDPGDAGDAVRFMTIHGAKGLEAPIVWLLDTASKGPPQRGYRTLVEWPAHAPAPVHFSFWTREAALCAAQRDVFERMRARAAREELNLLYVAATRARQVLVVSGHHRQGGENAWYAMLRRAVLQLRGEAVDPGGLLVHGTALPAMDPASEAALRAQDGGRTMARHGPALDPADAPAPDPRLNRPVATAPLVAAALPALNRAGARHGQYFHALMERMTESPSLQAVPSAGMAAVPEVTIAARLARIDEAERERLRQALGAGTAEFDRLWLQAIRVLSSPALARFFDPALYHRARNEVDYLDASGALRRVDRLVEFDQEVWVIDYKTGDPAAMEPWLDGYLAQVGDYAAAMAALHPGKPVSAGLVLGDGSLVRWVPPV